MKKNLKGKELKKVIKEFNFKPSFNRLIVTVNRLENNKGVITTEDALDSIQYVIASGESSKFEPGEKIMLDLDRLTVVERSASDQTQTISRIKISPFIHGDMVFTSLFDNEVMGKFI